MPAAASRAVSAAATPTTSKSIGPSTTRARQPSCAVPTAHSCGHTTESSSEVQVTENSAAPCRSRRRLGVRLQAADGQRAGHQPQPHRRQPAQGTSTASSTGRVAGDDVLRGLAVAEVLQHVGLVRRHPQHVAGFDLDDVLEVVAPGDLHPAADHVDGRLARWRGSAGVTSNPRARGRCP